MRASRPLRILLLLSLLNLKPVIAGERYRLLFSRLEPGRIGLFLANADGRNERALLPAGSLDYNASFSMDGKWIVFTSERGSKSDGSTNIFRVHPDGSGLERLTDDPAFDDQAALSPDGSMLAFVSTREGGFANICCRICRARAAAPGRSQKQTRVVSGPVGRRTGSGSHLLPIATRSLRDGAAGRS